MRTRQAIVLAALLAVGHARAGEVTDAKPEGGESAASSERPGSVKIPLALPLELMAFGDIQYHFQHPFADEFRIGSLELDAALTLAPYAIAATAIAYDADAEAMTLASFVVDGGLFGEGEHHLWQSRVIQRSGVLVGLFDVPVGTAYLEYPSVAGRFAELPGSVLATHGAWSDLGIQVYGQSEYLNLIGFFVNGPDYVVENDDGTSEVDAARFAAGGRVGLTPLPGIELGASLARAVHEQDQGMRLYGVDLAAKAGNLDLRGEYLARRVAHSAPGSRVDGAYARAVYSLDPAYLMLRYDVVFQGRTLEQRTLDAGAGVEVFPGGEMRAVVTRGFDAKTWIACLQIVGGSTFQPTGFRHLGDE